MVNRAWSDKAGVRLWSAERDPEAEQDLTIEGRPPAQLAEIHRGLVAEQEADEGDDVDFVFDAVPKLSGACAVSVPRTRCPTARW